MPPKKTPFQEKHLEQYGLKITSRVSETGEIKNVACKFCIFFSREENVGAKRARTSNVKYFSPPFRTVNYRTHLESQHKVQWEQYSALSKEVKLTYFENKQDTRSTLHAHYEGEGSHKFKISEGIVVRIIGELLFHPDDHEGSSQARALSIFKKCEEDDSVLLAEVKSWRMFQLVLKFIRDGASFRQACKFVTSVKEETGLAFYSGCNEGFCAKVVRIMVAVNLQVLKDLLEQSWAFSVAIDCGNKRSTNYLDIRIRLYSIKDGDIHNFHVVAVPVFGAKTAKQICYLLTSVLEVLCPNWKAKLLGFTSDGEPTMTGHVGGVGTLLQKEASHEIFHFWCGLHQLDLVVQKAFLKLANEIFIAQMNSLIGYLRRQQKLQTEMQTTCPRFVDTRWALMKRVTGWFVANKIRVLQYLDEKNPPARPSPEWWIYLVALDVVAGESLKVVKSLQGKRTLVTEQQAKLIKLRDNLKDLCSATELPEDGFQDDVDYVNVASFFVSLPSVSEFILDLGLFVQSKLQEIPQDKTKDVYRSVGLMLCSLLAGVEELLTNNDIKENDMPPTLPHELAKLRRSTITELVRNQLGRLRAAGWSEEKVEQVEAEHGELRNFSRDHDEFRSTLEEESPDISFKDAWERVEAMTVDVDPLKQFCGALSTVFPTTATVEADFSAIGIQKDDYRKSLTDFSLEGCLHAKQFQELQKLV